MTAPGTWEPRPATRWEDAFLCGNGRHGALVYGDPRDDRVIVTHHTLVRPNGSEDVRTPRLADGLPDLQDALLAGDTTAAERFGADCPQRSVQPFHPAFQVRVRRPATTTGDYRRELDFATGVASASCDGWHSEVFVSRTDDVVVQYVTAAAGALDARVVLDTGLPGAPEGLRSEYDCALRGSPVHTAVLTVRADYPSGAAAYTGTTVAAVVGGRTVGDGGALRVCGATALLLLTRVRRHRAGRDPSAAQARALRSLLPSTARGARAAYARLLGRHVPPHRDAWTRAGLTLPVPEGERALAGSELLRRPPGPALLERLFAAGRYHLLSSAGLLPPRLTGLWTGDWDTAWSGGFTCDANLNLQLASAAVAALPEVSEAHAQLVYGQLDDWRENARALFGARGIVAPAHSDGASGRTYHFERRYPLHLWTAGADWMLHPLLDHAAATGSRDPRLAGALTETAQFYEDFLTRTGPDGRIVIVPSYSPENRPANAGWGTLNATMDIAAARHALSTAACHAPGHPGAARWAALAGRLPRYRVNDDGALAEWAWPGLKDSYDHRHLSHLYPVWPLDEINPDDTPRLAAAAHQALRLRGSENDSAHGHLHTALVAARLRDCARAGDALDRLLRGDFFHDSLMSAHYPGRRVYNADAAHTLPAVLIECLVHSGPGRLVLLPALPASCPSGELRGLRTRFGARLDLAWEGGEAVARLRSPVARRVEVVAGRRRFPVELAAGRDREVRVCLDG